MWITFQEDSLNNCFIQLFSFIPRPYKFDWYIFIFQNRNVEDILFRHETVEQVCNAIKLLRFVQYVLIICLFVQMYAYADLPSISSIKVIICVITVLIHYNNNY